MNRVMIAGTNSGCGKTTVTCAILQALVNRKMTVESFKCGPDYIDPIFHSRIIGIKSHNLDSWFCNSDTLNFILNNSKKDIAIIEGVMGFYDGVGNSFSSCQTAVQTGTPVVIIIDCKGMSASIGAVMKGFLTFRQDNNIAGFIFNRLPESLIEQVKNMCVEMNVEYFGRLPYNKNLSIESRHLGLVTDTEFNEIKQKMQLLAEYAEKYILIDKIIGFSEKKKNVKYNDFKINYTTENRLKIAVSYDEAFCFCYRDNIDFLENSGCEIINFSPLYDKVLPENIDGLIITGGYPELYADRLSKNKSMLESIKNKINSEIPTIAECGGFMYLHEFIQSDNGSYFPMAGTVKGKCFKTEKLQRFGYIEITSNNDNLLCKKGESLKAHEFHYWNSTNCGDDFTAKKLSNGIEYECIHANENFYGGYPHLYFYANPKCVANFLKRCEKYRKNEKIERYKTD